MELKNKRFEMRISETDLARLDYAAQTTGLSRSEVLIELLRQECEAEVPFAAFDEEAEQ